MRAHPLRFPCVTAACCTLACCTGCILPIPLAVYPAPAQGSGMTITFLDQGGRRIHEDGLLVLEREYWGILHPRDTGQLLEIQDGQVVLPHKCILKSIWLGWYFFNPLYPVVGVNLTEGVQMYPFVSGYGNEGVISNSDFEDGNVTLLDPSAQEYSALITWDLDFGDIRSSGQPPTDNEFEVVLPEQDYRRLKQHVDKELARLRSLSPPATQPVPTSLPTSQPP